MLYEVLKDFQFKGLKAKKGYILYESSGYIYILYPNKVREGVDFEREYCEIQDIFDLQNNGYIL